jgi:hypothetical protein
MSRNAAFYLLACHFMTCFENHVQDELKNGKLIAPIPVNPTGRENNIKIFSEAVKNLTGHHDFYIKFPTVKESAIFIKLLRFVK